MVADVARGGGELVGTAKGEPYDRLSGVPTGGLAGKRGRSQKGLAAGLGDLELDPESDGELWCEVWGAERGAAVMVRYVFEKSPCLWLSCKRTSWVWGLAPMEKRQGEESRGSGGVEPDGAGWSWMQPLSQTPHFCCGVLFLWCAGVEVCL